MLTREQIIQNIDAMEQQGAPRDVIQSYLNDLPKEQPKTGVEPAFKASIGGAKTIIPNVAKSIGNIPSSAANIVDGAIQSTAGSIGKSLGLATEIYKNRGFVEGSKDIASGFADTAVKIFKTPGEYLVKTNENLLKIREQEKKQKEVDKLTKKIYEAKNSGNKVLEKQLIGQLRGINPKLQELVAEVGNKEDRSVKGIEQLTSAAKYPIERPLDIPLAMYAGPNKSGVDAITKFASPVTRGANTSLSNITQKIVAPITPNSVNIMNRVARIDPSDAIKFEKLSGGESHGAYLQRTGNFGTPQKIVENEAKKFANSLKEVDDSFATLEGRFKSKPVDSILDDLVKREKQIGVADSETGKVAEFYRKNVEGGLDMTEINWAKRKYERDVKLGYLKENNTIGVARSTRLDNALREWQFKKADDLGLKNLPNLNKQTQLSKFIIEKVGKKITGQTGNNALGLTDWIILSGGDPTAISAFLLKKGLLNKGAMAKVAKIFAKNPSVGPITAEFGGKTGLPAKIPGRDYGTTIEMKGPKTPTTYEAPAQRINKIDSLPEQKLLTAPKSNNQGIPLALPKSIRETNLGLDEVRNTIGGQTNRIQTPPPKLLPTQSGKSYPPIVPPNKPKVKPPITPLKSKNVNKPVGNVDKSNEIRKIALNNKVKISIRPESNRTIHIDTFESFQKQQGNFKKTIDDIIKYAKDNGVRITVTPGRLRFTDKLDVPRLEATFRKAGFTDNPQVNKQRGTLVYDPKNI